MSEKNANNVEQIRDLIFGAQIKDFEGKFNQLNTALVKMEEKLVHSFTSSHQSLQKETERSLEMLEKKLDNLTVSSQKERMKLKELISTTDENLQELASLQKDEFDTKIKMFRESAADEHHKLHALMDAMKTELHALLDEKAAKLTDEKLSRDTMAHMLIDVAMKIQQTDIQKLLIKEETSEK